MMKSFARAIALATFGLAVLFAMNEYGLFDFRAVGRAFQAHWPLVAGIALSQAALGFILMYRYSLIVRLVGIEVPFPQLSAATFVSNAVGQWAPGALAVIEVIRMSLMLGGEKKAGGVNNANASRLAVAALYDRLVGFFCMLLLGGVATLVALSGALSEGRLRASPDDPRFMALSALAVFSFLGVVCVFLTPLAARWRVTHSFFLRARRIAAGRPAVERALGKIQSLVGILGEGADALPRFGFPLLLSSVCMVLSCFGLWLASLAIGETISFWTILACFPVTAIASLFPLGFGGLGGYQLVAVAVFGAFGVAPTLVSSANVIQNALLLAVNTVLGALYAHHSSRQIAAILQRRREAKQRALVP